MQHCSGHDPELYKVFFRIFVSFIREKLMAVHRTRGYPTPGCIPKESRKTREKSNGQYSQGNVTMDRERRTNPPKDRTKVETETTALDGIST